jgi:hypothetical protein
VRITSSVCRAVNVVFSADFIEDFKTVNDPKSRQEHKTKNIYKAFWICAALAYYACMETREDETEIVLVEKATLPARNGEIVAHPAGARSANCAILFPGRNKNDDDNDTGSNSSQSSSSGGGKPFSVDKVLRNQGDNGGDMGGASDDFGIIVDDEHLLGDDFGIIVDNENLLELASDPDINLSLVDQSDTKAFTKKIMALFAVRRKMQNNMTVLGTHESNPWHFVENAMLGTSGLNKILAYYFYQQCKANKDIDSNFQPFLDLSLKGDSISEWDNIDDSPAISGSQMNAAKAIKDAESTTASLMQGIMDQGNTLLKHFESSAKHFEPSNNKLAKNNCNSMLGSTSPKHSATRTSFVSLWKKPNLGRRSEQ